ncbi:MAG: hypothetical protein ACP5UC_01370 [Candidatus Micrarchaeia archaeon]
MKDLMKGIDSRSAFFIALSLIFFINISEFVEFGEISNGVLAAEGVSFALYIGTMLFALHISRSKAEAEHESNSFHTISHNRASISFNKLLWSSVAVMLALVLYNAYTVATFGYPLSAIISLSLEYTVNFVLILFSLSLVAVASSIYGYKSFLKRNQFALLLLSIAIFAILAFYLSGAIKYLMNDETYIGIQGAKMLVSGANPYMYNVAVQLYNSFESNVVTSPTITSSGAVVGTLGYPILYAVTLLPFYYAQGSMSFASFETIPAEIGIFLSFFLLLSFFAMDFEKKRTMVYGVILIMPFFLLTLTFPSSILLLVLLALSLWKINSRYVGIALGFAASLQQISWVPILLTLVYIFISQGKRRGLLALSLTALVFLLLNGYFIAANAAAFVHAVFLPISSSLLPGSYGIFGFAALLAGIRQGAVSHLYYIALAFSVFAMLVLKRKEAIAPLSMLPFAFMNHGVTFYYTLFITLAIVSLALKDESPASKAWATFSRNRKHATIKNSLLLGLDKSTLIFIAVFVLMVLATFAYLSTQRQVPYLNFSNVSISTINGSNYYSAYIAAKEGSFNDYHTILFGMHKGEDVVLLFGVFGQNILLVNGTSSLQRNYTFSVFDVNPNVLYLQNSSKAKIDIFSGNSTISRCVIYNSTSFILCPIAKVQQGVS